MFRLYQKKMKPYKITHIILITYSGKRIPLEIVSSEIINKPLKSMKEKILDSFKTMTDTPIDCEIKIKYV